MDCFEFFNFITILKESIKLLGKNTKSMALVTSLSMISYSIFFLTFSSSSSNFFIFHDMIVAKESMLPIFTSLVFKIVSDVTKTVNDLPTAFVPLYFIITFLSTSAAVTVASRSFNGGPLTLRDLSSSVAKSSARTLVTALYTTVSVVGFECLVLYAAIPLLGSSLRSSNVAARVAAVMYGVAVAGLCVYVCGVWILALVVSVVEEDGSGIAAFGKSAVIMKGMRLDAFLLNFLFVFFTYFVVLVSWILMMGGDDWKVWGLFLVNFCCLIRVLTFVAYTVFYFRGKELGQRVELQYANLEIITPIFGQ